MYLKRGLKRQSCDFCFRRKVRCDRPSRRAEGHSQCSHCELRELPCIAESSSAGRHNRRNADSTSRSISRTIETGPDSGQAVSNNSQPPTSPTDTIIIGDDISSPSLPTTATDSSPNHEPTLLQGVQDTTADFAWQEMGWELGTDSVSFLDSIFTQNYDFDIMPGISPRETSGEVENYPSPYQISEIGPSTLNTAIEAYFDLASLALPILSREAFMADYKSHRASPSLVYAVGCRGCPFSSITQKWVVQQQLASQFRDQFLHARLAAENDQSIRLDDLEALALMIEFPYETAGNTTTSLHSQLGNLFLTHDSLVLMTLQYQILGQAYLSDGSSEPLYGAEDRKRLLFWHVYGTDAFHTLDQKIPSRIRDTEADLPKKPEHEERTYLDCILSLAIIARKIQQALPGPKVGSESTLHDEVANLYNQLAEWRRTLPFHLQSCNDKGKFFESSKSYPLQPAVLLFLEHNCYLQVEASASKCGIHKLTSLEAVMLNHLIEYETLKTTKRIIDIIPWLQSQRIQKNASTDDTGYSLIDLAPSVLRNICAGTCYWLSERGLRLLSGDMPIRPAGIEIQNGESRTKGYLMKAAGNFMNAAVTLRDAVETAGSHMDTLAMVEQLDKQISSLKQVTKHIDNT
ncbi:hypothetical protein F53441_12657 [Fusarium austroafricanum]|uniref:Zn(2)-C6 fungal-type domain-containing protein n=1 Tax=Fusarium austroafricanum TaxID=2364996 RepID=A0A8H4JW13_9HYPO|nr:hypothetical protein F53441_12657 [Fusarium austroafricanum]